MKKFFLFLFCLFLSFLDAFAQLDLTPVFNFTPTSSTINYWSFKYNGSQSNLSSCSYGTQVQFHFTLSENAGNGFFWRLDNVLGTVSNDKYSVTLYVYDPSNYTVDGARFTSGGYYVPCQSYTASQINQNSSWGAYSFDFNFKLTADCFKYLNKGFAVKIENDDTEASVLILFPNPGSSLVSYPISFQKFYVNNTNYSFLSNTQCYEFPNSSNYPVYSFDLTKNPGVPTVNVVASCNKSLQYAVEVVHYYKNNNTWNAYGSSQTSFGNGNPSLSSFFSNSNSIYNSCKSGDYFLLKLKARNIWDYIEYTLSTIIVSGYYPLMCSTLGITNAGVVSGGSVSGGFGNNSVSFQSCTNNSSWTTINSSLPSSITLPSVNTSYHVIYNNSKGCGSVTSNTVTLTIELSASINTSSGYKKDGDYVSKGSSFNIGVTDVKGSIGNYSYQWYLDDSKISNATSNYYSVSSIQKTSIYKCVITSGTSSITKTIKINVYPDLSVSYGSFPDKIKKGSTGTFSISASGGSNSYSYQWYVSDDNLSYSAISNATKSSLSITNNDNDLDNSKNKFYKVKVTDACGYTAESSVKSVIFYKDLSLTVNSVVNPTTLYNNQYYIYNTKVSFSVSTSGGIGSRSLNYYTSNDNVNYVSNIELENNNYIYLNKYYTNPLYVKFVVTDQKDNSKTKILSYQNLLEFNAGSFIDKNITINSGESCNFDVSNCPSGGSGNYTYTWYYSFTNTENSNWIELDSEFSNSSVGSFSPIRNTYYKCKVYDNITNEEKYINGIYGVFVKINGGKISLSNLNSICDTSICYQQSLNLLNLITPCGGSNDFSYQWYYKEDDMNSYQMLNTSYFDGISPQGLSLGNNIVFKKNTQFYRFVVDKHNSTNYAYSDTIKISVYKPFVVNFPDDKTICFNTVPDTMMVYASGGVGNYTYSWFNLADEISSSVKIDTLSKTDSLYNWNYLRQGTSSMVGKTPFKVQVFDECASEMGPGYLEKTFYVSMLGKVELFSPNIYSSLDQILFGKKSIDFDAGSTDSYYVKTNEPIAGSGNFTYKWYFKSINGEWNQGFDNSNSLYHLVNLSTLTDTSLFRYSVSDNICPNDFVLSDSVQFNYISFNKPILNNNQVQQLCYNSIPEPIRMTTRPGVANYTYSWYKSVDGGQTYSELLGYVGDTLVFADVANNRLTSDALFKVRVQLVIGSNARYLESDPITVQVVSQVNPGQITIGNGGNGSVVDNDTVIYNMTSPLLRNLQSADGGHINASSVSYQWYKKEGAQTIFSPIDGAINADYQPGQVKLTTSYYRAVNDVCASSYSNIITVNIKNVSISENIGGNNGGNSENGGGNNNGGNNGNNGGNNNGGESNNGTQNHEGSLDLTPDLDYLGDNFVYQGGGIWEKTASNNPLKKARYCRGSNVNLNLNVDIIGTYIWLDDSENEIKKGSKFSISNIQNDTIVKAQIYDTEGVLVLEQLYIITVVDAYPEFKASKVHVEAGESVRFTNSTKDLKSALWSFGDGTDVSFADEPWHYFVKPGTFTVTLTTVNKLGCKATLTKNEYIIVDEYSGSEYTDINNNKSFDVQVFPNPAKDILYVRGEKDLSIKMFSSQGTILYSVDGSNDFDIDMSNLSEGVYMLKISDGSWIISRKVIKQ